MDGTLGFTSEEIVALARAIEAAEERGDHQEAIRLSSLPWVEARHWLDAHGYAYVRDSAAGDAPGRAVPGR